MAADPASEADALYALPLERFIRERDALAKRLRKEGEGEEADTVKGLRKPTVVAWAVNQLAHHHREELRELLAAADRLRDAQTGRGGDFAEAAAAEREAVRSLTRTAGTLLAADGRPAGDATLDRVARTLHAAAADDQARERLERGVLTEEVEATGFGGLLGALTPAETARGGGTAPAPKRDDVQRRRKEAREAVMRARAHAKELRAEATGAEREAAQLRRAAERAERDAEKARERAEGAEAEVERAETRLAEL